MRWGFECNENATIHMYPNENQSSNGVSGGLALKFNSYSGRGSIGCYQDS